MIEPVPPPSKAGLLGAVIRIIEVDSPDLLPHTDGSPEAEE